MDDIISAVACMTSVKADSQFIILDNSIINPGKFFKILSDFWSLSGHCFKGNTAVSLSSENFIESFDDLCSSDFDTGTYMSTWMKDQSVAPAGNRAVDFFCQKFYGKRERLWFYWITEVDDIRCMNDNFINSVFFHIFPCWFDIQFTDFFSAGILWGSGIKHKCIGTVRNGFFRRTKKHFFSTHANVWT